MKIFQIVDNFCYYDATLVHSSLADTKDKYPSDVLFVEAPDNVFEGWGFDPNAEGDDRFVKPTPPEGWLYDDVTGMFYPEDGEKPTTPESEVAILRAKNAQLEAKIGALETQDSTLEECIVEIANVVYA